MVRSPIAFPRIHCYQMWHPQPDRPSDVGWLRGLIDEVSGTLTAERGTKRASAKKAASVTGETMRPPPLEAV